MACHSTLYGPLTDLTPVTERSLAQRHKTFYLKCFSSWTWRVKKFWCPWILTYNKCQQIQHGSKVWNSVIIIYFYFVIKMVCGLFYISKLSVWPMYYFSVRPMMWILPVEPQNSSHITSLKPTQIVLSFTFFVTMFFWHYCMLPRKQT